MDELMLARWQFAITTVYHYIFVPLTIGLAILVAGMQTAWYRTKKPVYLKMTKFWGKLFLINFAIGVVTGIVQEFQFGMNWSEYSRFVGDVFGAPLAIEGLVAFYLESTLLGIWIFGWDRVSPKLHLAAIWLAAIGSILSAVFILVANAWMQNPVGFAINAERNRAELNDFFAVLFNKVALVVVPHTLAAAFMTGALFLVGVSAWHLMRKNETEVFQKSMRIGLIVGFVTSAIVAGTGHWQGQVIANVQPMKNAAAEALWNTKSGAPFSIVTWIDTKNQENKFDIAVPNLLSFLATNDFNGEVKGINDMNQELQAKYGPGDYRPNIPITYWAFRIMVYSAMIITLLCAVGLYFSYRKNIENYRWFLIASFAAMFVPFIANSAAWVATEVGRQPWVVYGVMTTRSAVSPGVPAGSVLTTLIGFTLVYGILAYIELRLIAKFVKAGPPKLLDADEKTEKTNTTPASALVY